MNTFLTTNNLLLSLPLRGCIWFTLLFLVCFFGAHITKLAKEGWLARKQPPEKNEAKPENKTNEPKKEEPKPNPSQEVMYYIVEKKRRRPKQEYGEPKPIRFQ